MFYTKLLTVVCKVHFVKGIEDKAQNHSGHTGKNHTGELDVADIYLDAGKSGNEDNRSQGLIPVFSVVNSGIHQNAESGGPGIVWISADSFPMKEQTMEMMAAPAMT